MRLLLASTAVPSASGTLARREPRKTSTPKINKKHRKKPTKKWAEFATVFSLNMTLDAVSKRDNNFIKNNKFDIDSPHLYPKLSRNDDTSTAAASNGMQTKEQTLWSDLSSISRFVDDVSILTTDVLPKSLLEAIRRRGSLASSTIASSTNHKNQGVAIVIEPQEISSVRTQTLSSGNALPIKDNKIMLNRPSGNSNEPTNKNRARKKRKTQNQSSPACLSHRKSQVMDKASPGLQRLECGEAIDARVCRVQDPMSLVKQKSKAKRTEIPLSSATTSETQDESSFSSYYHCSEATGSVDSSDPARRRHNSRQQNQWPLLLLISSPRCRTSGSHPHGSPVKRLSRFFRNMIQQEAAASAVDRTRKHLVETGPPGDARFFPDLTDNDEDNDYGLLLYKPVQVAR